MAITLENTSRRMHVFNLDDETLVASTGPHGAQEIKTITVDHLPTGELIGRTNTKKVPASLTLAAGEVCADLPDEVQQCAQVQAALRNGDIRIVEQTGDQPRARSRAPVAHEVPQKEYTR